MKKKKTPDRNLDTSCPAGIPCDKEYILLKNKNQSQYNSRHQNDTSLNEEHKQWWFLDMCHINNLRKHSKQILNLFTII